MNKAKCLNCGDIIHSKHRHDFVSCKCSKESDRLNREVSEAVLRNLKRYPGGFTESQYDNIAHQVGCAVSSTFRTGFSLDGGDEYCSVSGNFEDVAWIEEGE